VSRDELDRRINPRRIKPRSTVADLAQFDIRGVEQQISMEYTSDEYTNATEKSPLAATTEGGKIYSESSATVLISEEAVKNIYVAIGTIGFFGNLIVFVVMTLYTNVKDKVCTAVVLRFN
jgi:hypothetical protein